MADHECYHCKQWVEEGEAHDCWTTTEGALTRDLSDDLRDAWERLRETAASFGEQRIYASHHSIMFSRKTCYFFVRPKQKNLELCVFLGRRLEGPQVRRVDQASKSKLYHLIRITHRDEVEAPITDWRKRMSWRGSCPNRASRSRMAGQRKWGLSAKRRPVRLRARPVENQNRLRSGIRRNNWRAFAGFAVRSQARSRNSRTASRHSSLRNESSPMFAGNHHDDGHVAVWLPAAPGVQADLIEESPDTYFRPP
jgi:hypothetical protein